MQLHHTAPSCRLIAGRRAPPGQLMLLVGTNIAKGTQKPQETLLESSAIKRLRKSIVKAQVMFNYAPLDRDNAEIRLVRFVDACAAEQTTSPISLQLRHASLEDDALSFDAISYAWGDPAESRAVEVLVDNAALPISRNLHEGLIQLRDNGVRSWLWVDSICIEQSNTEEKTWQVNQMRSIYSQADRVHIWLGLSCTMMDEAMDFINRMGPRALALDASYIWSPRGEKDETIRSVIKNYIKDRLKSSNPEGPALFQLLFDAFVEAGLQRGPDDYTTLQRGIKRLMMSDYWSRIWVNQEVSLAKEPLLACGSKTISLDALDAVLCAIELGPRWLEDDDGSSYYVFAAYLQGPVVFECLPLVTRRRLRRGIGVKAVDILQQFGTPVRAHYLASDPRDILFGVLGLIDDSQKIGLKADYNITTVQVFETVTRHLIDESLGKFPTRYYFNIWTPQDPSDTPSLPSWVPDWKNIGDKGGSLSMNSIVSDIHVGATSGKASDQPHVRKTETPGVIRLLGCQVDVVEEVMELPQAFEDTQALSSAIVRLVHSSAESGPGEDFIWRTVTRGRFNHMWEGHENDPSIASLERAMCRGEDISSIKSLDSKQEDFLSYWMQSQVHVPCKSTHDALMHVRSWEVQLQQGLLRNGRTLFKTTKAMLAQGTNKIKAGDVVVLLWGVYVPIVLRPRDGDAGRGYVYIADVYVDGIMDGEFLRTSPAERVFDIY